MPISVTDYGVHKNILILDFGVGDILMSRARTEGEKRESLLLLSQSTPHPIGTLHNEYVGKSSDDIPDIKAVLAFANSASIRSMIDILQELEVEICKNEVEQNEQYDF